MKTKLLVALVVTVLASTAVLLFAQTQKEERAIIAPSLDKIEITVSKVNEHDDGRLLFIVRNCGSHGVKVVEDYLPWNTTCALKLLVVPFAKGAVPVEAMLPLDNPRTTVQEIAGMAELRGELDAARYFPQWNKLVKQGVLLVWSLNLYDVDTGKNRRFNGVIEYQSK